MTKGLFMAKTKFQANITCYLWDLEDEGIDDVLDRVKGEAGITGITVPVTCGPVEIFRVHPDVSPRTFRSDGGLQFQPRAEYYEGTRLKPVVAEWLKTRDPLAKVAEACAKRNLKLRARIEDPCYRPVHASKHYDECLIQDAFGEPRPQHLCPSNPDFRELLCSILRDICDRYPLDAIELECPCFTDEVADSGAPFHDDFFWVGNWLTTLCFCASCRQSGEQEEVDVAAAARSTRVTLEQYIASARIPKFTVEGDAPEETVNAFLDTDPILKAFAEWRCGQVTTLVEQIRKSCTTRLVIDDFFSSPLYGANTKDIARHCDATMDFAVYGESDNNEGIQTILDTKRKKWGFEADRLELGLPTGLMTEKDSTAIVSVAGAAAKHGIRCIYFDCYEDIMYSRLDWIHQAVRYAMREVQ